MNTYCAHPLINAQVERLLGNDIAFIQTPGLMTGSSRRRRQANRRQTRRSEACRSSISRFATSSWL
jgi:hypothetical protein